MRIMRDAVVTILALIVVLLAVGVLALRNGGLSADAQPGPFERAVAARALRLSIPNAAERQQNPFAADAQAWKSAADHFEDHCAVCHGADGHGKTEMGERMYPPVPDLSNADVQARSDGALFYIIQNGVRWTGMPAWKGEHTPEESWRLVSFIRKVPSLTTQDLESAGVDMSHPAGSHEHSPEEHEHEHEHEPPRQ
jgi:mono/diheme cytochrome c family protein